MKLLIHHPCIIVGKERRSHVLQRFLAIVDLRLALVDSTSSDATTQTRLSKLGSHQGNSPIVRDLIEI
jgi:hypothetical protein